MNILSVESYSQTYYLYLFVSIRRKSFEHLVKTLIGMSILSCCFHSLKRRKKPDTMLCRDPQNPPVSLLLLSQAFHHHFIIKTSEKPSHHHRNVSKTGHFTMDSSIKHGCFSWSEIPCLTKVTPQSASSNQGGASGRPLLRSSILTPTLPRRQIATQNSALISGQIWGWNFNHNTYIYIIYVYIHMYVYLSIYIYMVISNRI